MRNYILFVVLFAFTATEAQKLKKEDKQTVANLQKHVEYLASDKLEGRRIGTPGEQLAMAYIREQFKTAGLQPRGSNDFYQPFEIDEGRQINPSTYLTVGGQALQINHDFFPLSFSSNIIIEALPSMAIQELQMPWFVDIKEMVETNSKNPHFNMNDALRAKAKELHKKGATAIFFYNTSATEDGIRFDGKDRSEVLTFPVVYLTKAAVKKYFHDSEATLDIKLKTEIAPKKRTGSNVVGFIDNKASTTVVLGAHFDHIGYGEDGNSLLPGSKQIHNGADDNASGISALIELGRLLKASDLKQNNYLFIAFSGEELGLIGSKYFTEHPTIDLSTINYMINMDMIGRLNNAVTVGGFGTSPAWASLYAASGKRGLYNSGISFKFDSSGAGPSDHTSFYVKNIPVLFYFTGVHADYHKPTDDFDKINYTGQLNILKHIHSLIEALNKPNNKIAFLKTRETVSTASAQFSVTLGIMPDYAFSGSGVRIDNISENKPAQKAGLKQGDVIIKLGDYSIASLEHYMQALGKFKKGDKTKVYFSRGAEKLSSDVEF